MLTDAAFGNAMVVHAAFGGSTNLLLHVPAIAHAAGLRRPTVADWMRVNRAGSAAGGCAAEWAGWVCYGAGVSGWRRAGGDAASARGGAAGYCDAMTATGRRWRESGLVGAERAAARAEGESAGAGWDRCGGCDYVAGSGDGGAG